MKQRSYFNTQQEWLWYLYNDLGYSKLRICLNKYKNKKTYFSKWFYFHELMHKSPDEKIKVWFSNGCCEYMTRNEIIEKATHRSVLDIEIVYDIDDKLWEQRMELSSIKYKAKCINKKVLGQVWFTGSKSYHIHTFFPTLRSCTPKKRIDYKASMLASTHSDLHKASDNCMIALEQANHYKSGKPKIMVKI